MIVNIRVTCEYCHIITFNLVMREWIKELREHKKETMKSRNLDSWIAEYKYTTK